MGPQGRAQQGGRRLRPAIELRPTDARVFYYRGIAWDAIGDREKAIADLSEAIRLDPKDRNSHYSHGVTRQHVGQDDEAIADYSEAIRLEPNDVYARADDRGVSGTRSEPSERRSPTSRTRSGSIRATVTFTSIGRAPGLVWEMTTRRSPTTPKRSRSIRGLPAASFQLRGLAWAGKGERDKALEDYDR